MLIDKRTNKPVDREGEQLLAELCSAEAYKALVGAIKDFGKEYDATNELFAHFMFALADSAASMLSSIVELEMDTEPTEAGEDQKRNIRNMIKADVSETEKIATKDARERLREMDAAG